LARSQKTSKNKKRRALCFCDFIAHRFLASRGVRAPKIPKQQKRLCATDENENAEREKRDALLGGRCYYYHKETREDVKKMRD
jgi:hypothetical protein